MTKINTKKLGIILLIIAVIFMILGLSLIGSVHEGFSILNYATVGDVLKWGSSEKEFFGSAIVTKLQAGAVFAAILTPIVFFCAFCALGHYFYTNKK